jgi:AcrR family transcriptional regulator
MMAFPSKTDSRTITVAAIDLLEREGEAALTLRRVAAQLGVTPNALYRYYRSRDVLVAAVANEVARRLLEAIDRALADIDESFEADSAVRVRVLMQVYADFAATHPTLYQTFTNAKASAAAELPAPFYLDLLWRRVIAILAPLTGQADAPAAAVTLWGLLHGIWALKQANRLGGGKPDSVDDFAFEALLKGLTPHPP